MSKSTSGLHDPYEDQLAAARYRAERDQALQEAKELREELETAKAEYQRNRANLVECYAKKADESRRRGKAMHDMSQLIRERNEEIKSLKERVAEMEPRLMPRGYEWPRYESGEPVQIGGEFMGKDGKTYAAKQIQFIGKCFSLFDFCDRKPQFSGFYGDRVKRPQDSAADDGCCDPGTYRCQEAAFTCDSCGHTVFVDKCMVDEVRYLRAKGIRTLNCCCGHGGKVEPFIIVNEGDECRMLNMGYERHVNEHGVTYFTPKSSRPTKVLAADGEPLEVGQTVWEVDGTGYPFKVVSIRTSTGRAMEPTVVTCDVGDGTSEHFLPSQLTHTKPEPPDSWDALWDDVEDCAVGYESFMRRCRALAERERSE